MKNTIYILSLFALSLFVTSCESDGGTFASQVEGAGVLSGSYANMLTLGDKLYVLGDGQLKTLSLANPALPEQIDSKTLDFDIESLFISDGNIFVGSPSGMRIYTIDSDGIPVFRSLTPYEAIGEIQPCDPIVANEDHAFATLSTSVDVENSCWRNVPLNELRVFDLENLEQPILINTVSMEEPKGVGLDGDHLFICESQNGLKILDVADPFNIEQLEHFPDFRAFDVIPANGLLLVVGPELLHQFDYSDITNVIKLSTFELQD